MSVLLSNILFCSSSVQAVADSGQGFVNGVLWCGLSLAVWQRCRQAFKRCLSRVNRCQVICVGACCQCVHSRPSNTAVRVLSPGSSSLNSFVSNEEEEGSNTVERLRY